MVKPAEAMFSNVQPHISPHYLLSFWKMAVLYTGPLVLSVHMLLTRDKWYYLTQILHINLDANFANLFGNAVFLVGHISKKPFSTKNKK